MFQATSQGDEISPPSKPARHLIAVGSGKGGVGKSTVALNLALALARHRSGPRVGILDADVYGPNIPLMVGLKRERWTKGWTLARNLAKHDVEPIPALTRYGLTLFSAGFILAEDQPMVLEAMTIRTLTRQLIREVAWGDLDHLVIDLPPGTADVQQAIAAEVAIDGAVIVVTPQDVAHLDAKKALRMYERSQIPILGAVENMSHTLCPHCGARVDLFSRVPAERSIWALGVEKLAEIPVSTELSQAGDSGRPLLVSHPDSPTAAAFHKLAARILVKLRAS